MIVGGTSSTLFEVKVSSRNFQRSFARMKAKAKAGETIIVTSGTEEFVFLVAKPRTWQKALPGKAAIKGSLFSTGLAWETS